MMKNSYPNEYFRPCDLIKTRFSDKNCWWCINENISHHSFKMVSLSSLGVVSWTVLLNVQSVLSSQWNLTLLQHWHQFQVCQTLRNNFPIILLALRRLLWYKKLWTVWLKSFFFFFRKSEDNLILYNQWSWLRDFDNPTWFQPVNIYVCIWFFMYMYKHIHKSHSKKWHGLLTSQRLCACGPINTKSSTEVDVTRISSLWRVGICNYSNSEIHHKLLNAS